MRVLGFRAEDPNTTLQSGLGLPDIGVPLWQCYLPGLRTCVGEMANTISVEACLMGTLGCSRLPAPCKTIDWKVVKCKLRCVFVCNEVSARV